MKKENEEITEVNETQETVETPQAEAPEITEEQAADQIADEMDQIKQQLSDMNDKNLRLMAEFDNFRKRTAKERLELIKTAGERVLVDLLPLVDDFERAQKAMETSEDVNAVKEGVELIYNKFISFLIQNGVKAIPTETVYGKSSTMVPS